MINPNHFDHSNHLITLTPLSDQPCPMTITIVATLTTCYLTNQGTLATTNILIPQPP